MTNIPLKISTINEINNKTITVTIEGEFLGTEEFSICKLVDETQMVEVEAVEDSIDPKPNKKVVVTQGIDLFETGSVYILTVTRGQEKDKKDFSVTSYKPPNTAAVRVFGDRVIKIEFPTPIRNLNAQDRVRENGIPNENYLELRNFYFLYDSLNISGSDSGDNQWLGLIRFARNEDDETIAGRLREHTVRVAPDFKSIEIQYNNKSVVTGRNRVIVHYSNNQNNNKLNTSKKFKDLTDFADPPRLVPVMTLGFDVKKSDQVAEAVKCEVISRTELIITYNDPVILLQTYRRGHLYINGKPAVAKYVRRVGNQFNQLKFVLESGSALPMNFADIRIDAIVDANGYVTGSKEFFKVPVISVAPKIKSLTQVDPPNEESTAMVALWTKEMKYFAGNPNMVGVVDNIANYKLFDFNNKEISISSLSYDQIDKELKIITSKLDSGLYTLKAENVEDELEEKMIPQLIQINIEDRTIPKIIEVVCRNYTDSNEPNYNVNAFVVKFDDIMSAIGEHSALETSNYLIEYKLDEKSKPLTNMVPMQTKVLGFNNNKWIRFNLPEGTNLLPQDVPLQIPGLPPPIDTKYILHIGYPMVKKIRYVEDASRNIYPLCDTKHFKSYEILNIEKGEKRVVADNKLRFTYTGNNEIYSVALGDFDFFIGEGNNTISRTAINAERKGWKTIEFTFPEGTFDGNVTDIKIKTVQHPLSTDIFGSPFEGGRMNTVKAANGLSPKVKSISLINKDDNDGFKATLRFVFSKFMRIFNKDDIKITLNSSEIPLVIQGNPQFINPQPNGTALVFDVVVKVPYSVSLNDVIWVSLANTNYIQSKDISGNPLSPFAPMLVEKFIASAFYWGYQQSNITLNKSFLQVTYNKAVNPSSIVKFKAVNVNDKPDNWNGTVFTIPAGKISFEKELNSNEFIMKIDSFTKPVPMTIPPLNNTVDVPADVSISFGIIKFYPNEALPTFIPKDSSTPTGYKTVYNTEEAVIVITEENKLTIKFNEKDAGEVNINAAGFAEYKPIKDITDAQNNNYLYESYQPTHIFPNTPI